MFHRLNRSFHRFLENAGERVRRLGDAIIWPIERAFAATFGRLLHAGEGLGRLDDLLLGLVRLLVWPFRLVGRAVAGMGRLLLPRFVRDGLASAGGALARANRGVGRSLVALAEALNLDGAVRWLVWLAQPLWRPIAAALGFAYAWLTTRPYRQMLWGVPALVLLLPIIAGATWSLVGEGRVITRYRLAVKQAREAGDYQLIQLYEQKLSQLGDDTQHINYNTALKLAEDGKLAEAYERMRQLAAPDKPGYPPAHYWITQRLLAGQLQETPEEAHRLAGLHLDQLAAARIKGPEIDFLRSEWLMRTGRLPEAAALLEPLERRFPPAAMQRMTINLALNDRAEASRDARIVAEHFRDRHRRQAELTAYEYQTWAIAESLLGDAAAQLEAFTAWSRKFPHDEVPKQGLVELARIEFERQLRSAQPDAAKLAERVKEAALLGGESTELSRQVARLFADRANSPTAAAALEQLIAAADTPPAVLQLLGTNLLLSGDVTQATALLKRSLDQDPRQPVAWNNYACSLMERPDADLEEALRAVERALELAPDMPQFRETRGQILVRLQRWQPAIEDLELAMNGMPDSKAIHRSLATAYAALGKADLAAIHQRQSQ